MTHLCVSKLTTIGSDNDLSPGRRQAIILTIVGILLIEPLGTNFSEIWIEICTFSSKKMHLKMSFGSLCLNVLKKSPHSFLGQWWPRSLMNKIKYIPGLRSLAEVKFRIRSHHDVIKWKHFQCYWPFVWGIHRSPVNFPHIGQQHGALMVSLICAWTNGWVNNRDASDLRRHLAHYEVVVMGSGIDIITNSNSWNWIWIELKKR